MNKCGRSIGIVVIAALGMLWASSCSCKKKLIAMPQVSDYQWMTAKMTMDITAPGLELNNVSGNLRMRRDSTVWISANAMLGMESVRTLITQDSVILINRMDQTYLAEPLDTVTESLNIPVSLSESQAMLLGDGSSNLVEVRFGPYSAKIRYTDIQWDKPTSFPIKINRKYERVKL